MSLNLSDFDTVLRDWLLDHGRSALPWFRDQIASNRQNPDKVQRLIENRQAVEWAMFMLAGKATELKRIGAKLQASDRGQFFSAMAIALAAAFEIGNKTSSSDASEIHLRSALGSAAGKQSGKSRLEDRRWVAKVDKLARDIRQKKLSISRQALAREIFGHRQSAGIDRPGLRTLQKHLKALEESGKLMPARKR
jgi:hypothetical protein